MPRLNGAPDGGHPEHAGNGFLFERGYTVMWSGWDPKTPLVDPCAGSGTVAIEAAMFARRMPPGRHRSFAWQSWPGASAVVAAAMGVMLTWDG